MEESLFDFEGDPNECVVSFLVLEYLCGRLSDEDQVLLVLVAAV